MELFGTIASTTVASTAIIGILGWIFNGPLLEWLKAGVRAEYDEKLERLKAELRRETEKELAVHRAQVEGAASEALAKLRKELDVLKEKEISGHRDKLHIYRLVVDVLADLYADIFKARNENDLTSVTHQYYRSWIRCYGYLSMLAPQEVMDAFDNVNDYVLQLLSGRVSPQEWAETRKLGLAMVNAIRRDVGIDESAIEYRGRL